MVVRTLAFVILRRILDLAGLGPAPDAKDVEIAVLRHQLMVVVRRQGAGPRYPPQDRAGVGDVGAAVAPGGGGRLPGHPRDAAALARGVGGPPLDVSGCRERPTWSGRRRGRA